MFWFRAAAQIVLLGLIAYISDLVTAMFRIPIPGALVGMGVLYLALCRGWVRLHWLEDGADLLIRDLLLFFIPAAVGIMQYTELFGRLGAFLVAAVIISILVMLWVISVSAMIVLKAKRRGIRR